MSEQYDTDGAPAIQRKRSYHVVCKTIRGGEIITCPDDTVHALFHEVEETREGEAGSDVLLTYLTRAEAEIACHALNTVVGTP